LMPCATKLSTDVIELLTGSITWLMTLIVNEATH
jgi:hypothetical protein